MSTNLTIAFSRYSSSPVLCYERFRLDWQDYNAFDRIFNEAIPLVGGVWWYQDDGIVFREKDPYDQPLTFMPAYRIAKHLDVAGLSKFDAAILVFIKVLPPDTAVILWWH